MATEAQRKANKKYREKGNRLTLDFYPTETELWEHINSQPNKQGYIKALIRADLEGAETRTFEAIIDEKTYAEALAILKKRGGEDAAD